jgi:hypothetical protein
MKNDGYDNSQIIRDFFEERGRLDRIRRRLADGIPGRKRAYLLGE